MSGVLRVEGVSAEALARRYGTPLYVYSAGEARMRLRSLRRAFRRREPLICYALKANSNRAVCAVLARAGAGADIVSGGELARALRAGFDPSETVFSGVGKTEEEMAAGLRAGLLTFNVESAEELDALARVAGRLKVIAPISVRLNPDVNPRTHPHITTGTAENKFGVEKGEAFALYRRAARDKRLRVVGIQCHIGSQITDLEPYRRAAASLAKTMKALDALGIPLSQIDVGGGIGITYKDEKPLPLPALAARPRGGVRAVARSAPPAGTGTLPRRRLGPAAHARALPQEDHEAPLRDRRRGHDGPAASRAVRRVAPGGGRSAASRPQPSRWTSSDRCASRGTSSRGSGACRLSSGGTFSRWARRGLTASP